MPRGTGMESFSRGGAEKGVLGEPLGTEPCCGLALDTAVTPQGLMELDRGAPVSTLRMWSLVNNSKPSKDHGGD